MSSGSSRVGPGGVAIGLGALACAAAGWHLGPPLAALLADTATAGYAPERMRLLYADLPRLVMALLCGGGLAASGAILQQVLRNPLAAPATLGIDAGARLALALATLFTPALLGFGRDLVALGGSAIVTAFVFLLARRDLSAVTLVLAGLVASLYCGALSAIIVLLNERYLASLFIWGAGALDQQSWQPVVDLAVRLVLVALPIALLVRPIGLLDLGDRSARAAGVPVGALRAGAVFLAVLPAALITSAVGVIGFVGLVAPLIARLSGAQRFAPRLVWSVAIGAGLLAATDSLIQAATAGTTLFLPTGAVTAMLGAPLLIALLPKLRRTTPPTAAPHQARGLSRAQGRRAIALAVACCIVVGLAVLVGRSPQGGWEWLSPDIWSVVMPWRLPRIVAAGGAGAMLALAGFILQRLTANPMASPEVLGVSAGCALAFAGSLFVLADPGPFAEVGIATLGGLAVLGAIVLAGRKAGFRPEVVVLAGIALNALLDAFVGLLSASGDPRAFVLLDWMGGSTHAVTGAEAAILAGIAAASVTLGALVARWLAMLPLGAPAASALGLPVPAARLVLLTLAACLTALATPIVGPLTFVGLMAPHIARALGLHRPLPALLGSVLAGVGVMALADWLARVAAFPYQLPTGLVAALVGAPFLMLLLQRRAR